MPIRDEGSISKSAVKSSQISSSPLTATTSPILAGTGLLDSRINRHGAESALDVHPLLSQNMLWLQRAVGNRAVGDLLQRTPQSQRRPQPSTSLIQRKATVAPANDPFEQEADRIAKQVSTTAAHPTSTSIGPTHAVPTVALRPSRPLIQRKVFFEIDELQQKDVANLEITKVNPGERPPFVKSRLKGVDRLTTKGKKSDYRHIVSYDLIKKALQNVLKSKTIVEAAQWLGTPAHWLDQNTVDDDILPPRMLNTVQGAQAAAYNWLKNANSYPANLWLGDRTENRQKGAKSASSKQRIRETWINAKPLGVWSDVDDIHAYDIASHSPLPFEDGQHLLFEDLKRDYNKRLDVDSLKYSLHVNSSGVIFKSMPGSKLEITLTNGETLTVSAIYRYGEKFYRVGRDFQGITGNLDYDRNEFYHAELDPKQDNSKDPDPYKTARKSLKMYNAAGTARLPVVNIALNNTKYLQTARLKNTDSPIDRAGGAIADPQLEATIQRAGNGGAQLDESVRAPLEQAFGANFAHVRVHTDSTSDQLNRSVNAKAFTTGHNIFFRQGHFKPNSADGRELLAHELTHVVQQEGHSSRGVMPLQRKVNFEVREKPNLLQLPLQPQHNNTSLKWKIKHVDISGRPPILKSRQED